MELLGIELSLAAEANFWVGHLDLADPAEWEALASGDALTVTVGGEDYSLLVDGKSHSKSGISAPRYRISVISSAARLAAPWADIADYEWTDPVMASVAAASVAGDVEITWELVDWEIPGGRLVFADATPMDVIITIAEAAGGKVESTPAGGLLVRHAFPVAVPEWGGATPDHSLSGVADILESDSSFAAREIVNSVVVRDYTPAEGFLAVEIDARGDGPNLGNTTWYPGDTAYLLVYAGPDVTDITLAASHGTLVMGGTATVTIKQVVRFEHSSTATLDKPATTLESTTWLGNALGDLTLEADGQTVSAPVAGVAMAQIEYSAVATSWALTIPEEITWLDDYPILISATATSDGAATTGEVICERDAGDHPGDDITEPLLATLEAKLSRGRAEIDTGEPLWEVTLTCLHRSGLRPGQLVEVQTTAATYRAQVVGVTHRVEGAVGKTTSKLELLRSD